MRRTSNFLILFVLFVSIFCLSAFAAERVVYVCDVGTGDGSAPETAIGSLADAYVVLGDEGGTIVLTGTTTISSKYLAPAHSGKVTITAAEDSTLDFLASFYCGGPTEFNNITLRNVGTEASPSPYNGIYGMAHDITLGVGIVSTRSEGCSNYLTIIGGSTTVYNNVSANIVIESGDWQRVRGGANKGGSTNYNITLTVNGGTFHENFILASAAPSGNNSHTGDVDATVDQFWQKNFSRVKPWYYEKQRPDDVVISASPEFLVRPACDRLGIRCVMGSPVDKHTGKFSGPNCHGKEKVNRFRKVFGSAHIEEFFSDSYSDTPLAELADKAWLVKDSKLLPW